MDVVSLKLARNYTNEKLNSLPSNAPTKTVSFDGGIYSVGNDVVNGQVSDIVIKGLTATNIVKNGNFEDTSNWTSIASSLSVSNNVLLITGSGTSAYPRAIGETSVNCETDKVVWVRGKIKITNSSCSELRFRIQGSNGGSQLNIANQVTPTENQLYVFNAKLTLTNQIGAMQIYVEHRYVDAGTANGAVAEVQEVFAIDMTAAGLDTLTADEMNAKFPHWFDGTKSTISAMRLRSVSADESQESIAYLPDVGELRSLPNGVKDEVNVSSGVKTQRNGTKTNVNSGTVINYADMATGGQFVAYAADGTSQVGVKGDTLTITAVSLTYQLAEPIVTKLPAQAPLQVYENGTVYVEPLGDPSETTLPSVEMTIPTGTSNKFGVASHDYDGAAADWVLTSNEGKCTMLKVANAGGAANIIAPDRVGKLFVVNNLSGQTVTVKKAGGTGVAITNGKTAIVMHNGTDYIKITEEV